MCPQFAGYSHSSALGPVPKGGNVPPGGMLDRLRLSERVWSSHPREAGRPQSPSFPAASRPRVDCSAGLRTRGCSPSSPLPCTCSQDQSLTQAVPTEPGGRQGAAMLQEQWDLTRVLPDPPSEGTKFYLLTCRAGPGHSHRPSGCPSQKQPELALESGWGRVWEAARSTPRLPVTSGLA